MRLRVVRAHSNYMGFVDPIYAPCTINLNRNAGLVGPWSARFVVAGLRDGYP